MMVFAMLKLVVLTAIHPQAALDLTLLLQQFLSLAGFAALVAVVVNVLKGFSVIKDGDSPIWVLVLNVIGFVIFVAINLFAPQVIIGQVDSFIGQLAVVLVGLLALVGQLGVSKVANLAVRGAPLIGFSYSFAREQAVKQGKA